MNSYLNDLKIESGIEAINQLTEELEVRVRERAKLCPHVNRVVASHKSSILGRDVLMVCTKCGASGNNWWRSKPDTQVEWLDALKLRAELTGPVRIHGEYLD